MYINGNKAAIIFNVENWERKRENYVVLSLKKKKKKNLAKRNKYLRILKNFFKFIKSSLHYEKFEQISVLHYLHFYILHGFPNISTVIPLAHFRYYY